MATIRLGQHVRDKVTNIEGIVTARTEYLYGCTRLQIMQVVAADGKLPEIYVTDEPQVDVLDEGLVEDGETFRGTAPAGKVAGRHGDRADTVRAAEPTR